MGGREAEGSVAQGLAAAAVVEQLHLRTILETRDGAGDGVRLGITGHRDVTHRCRRRAAAMGDGAGLAGGLGLYAHVIALSVVANLGREDAVAIGSDAQIVAAVVSSTSVALAAKPVTRALMA